MERYCRNSKSRHLFQVINARRFWLDFEPVAEVGLQVVLGGVEQCTAEYVCQREGFPLYCLELVVSGNGNLTLAEKDYLLESGILYTYGPGIPHRMCNAGKEALTKYYVAFCGTRAQDALHAIALSPGTVARAKNPELILQSLDLLVANGCLNMSHAGETCASAFKTLLGILADCIIPYDSTSSRALETFQRIKNLIDNEFLKLKSLQDVAVRSNINPAYLCRLFQRFEHNTVQQYLLARKMYYAAEILQSGDVLVKEVADRINYPDQYQFSRAFKKIVGVSPEQFARQSKISSLNSR